MKFAIRAGTAVLFWMQLSANNGVFANGNVGTKEMQAGGAGGSIGGQVGLELIHGEEETAEFDRVAEGHQPKESNPSLSTAGATNHDNLLLQDSVESFQLRSVANMEQLKNQIVEAQANGDKPERIKAAMQAFRGSSAMIQEAKEEMETALDTLHDVEEQNSPWVAYFKNAYQSTLTQLNSALELSPKMDSAIERAAPEILGEDKTETSAAASAQRNLMDVVPAPSQQNSTSLIKEEEDEEEEEADDTCPSDGSSSNLHQHKQDIARTNRRLHRQLKTNPHAKHHLDRVEDLHQTIEKGDHMALGRHLMQRVSRSNAATHGRRLSASDRTQKAEQCKIFMDCVGQMSIYDMILYYYSDDIDPNSGEIDDNIYRGRANAPDVYEVYNDADVQTARREFPNGRHASWYAYRDSRLDWCDRTLRLFFRNVEFGAVPHWEGATVSEVCLAQGSHTYVKLDEIATKVGFKAADEISEDMFDCSKALYNSLANPRLSPFPFTNQKVAIDVAASSVVETQRTSYGVSGGITGTAGQKSRIFDNNVGTSWRARDATRGFPQTLTMESDSGSKCACWEHNDSNEYVRARTCSNPGNGYSCRWYYDHTHDQIKSTRKEDNKVQCMRAKSSGGNDKVYVQNCDSSNDHQEWYKTSDDSIKNRRRNKCLQKSGDTMYVKSCDNGDDQEFEEVTGSLPFFSKKMLPHVEFKIQFASSGGVEIRGIEFKWKNGADCPNNKIQFLEGFHGSSFGVDWSSDVVTGNVRTRTAIPVSTTTVPRFRVKCTNPDVRIELYEIVVYGALAGGAGELPAFSGTYNNDFYSPTNVETGSSTRDEYGQVKGQSVTLYKYEEGLVKDNLQGLKITMAGTMDKVWSDWLRSGNDNLRLSLRARYDNHANDYDQSDSYMRMLEESKDNKEIKRQMVIGFAKKTKGSYNSNSHDDREDEFDDFNDSVKAKYGAVQDGFNMVFGKDASVGYVCGIKSQVVAGNTEAEQVSKFPGNCCLDAPFQNPGGEWGREFDCSMTCQTFAPFFAGLSEESCSAVGGTWCPGPTDCSVLQQCVNSEITTAQAGGKTAYVAYLEPGIVPAGQQYDYDSCADSTEYFGFDALYKNYDDICEHITQLANTKDFGFLDEVYAQGEPIEREDGDVGWRDLWAPDHAAYSETQVVQDGPMKEGLIFGFGLIRDNLAFYLDGANDYKCPIVIAAGNGENFVCTAITNTISKVLGVVLHLMNLALTSWQYAHGVTCTLTNIEPIQDWEILQVQHKNNEIMYDGMKETYSALLRVENDLFGTGFGSDNGKLGEILACVKDPSSCGSRRALMSSTTSSSKFAGCDGKDQDDDGVIDNCEEDKFPPELEVLSGLQVKVYEGMKHIEGKIFPSTDEALASIRGALSVLDDCAAKKDRGLNMTAKETSKCQAVVSATPIQWCNGLPMEGATEDFSVAVDTQAPTVSCGFHSSTMPDKKILFVEEGEDFFNAGLSVEVADTCSDVSVDVSVLSNEFDTTGPSAFLSLAKQKGDADLLVPNLFLKQATCSHSKKHGFCQESSVGVRVYEVAVEATDAAGWSATDTCHVVVTPKKDGEQRELLQPEENAAALVDEPGAQHKLESIHYVHHS